MKISANARQNFVLNLLCCLVILFTMSGCKEVLYSGLTEKEGNEMLSILLEQGITADKVSDAKGKSINLQVRSGQLSQAIQVLQRQGYPKENFSSVGELFKKDGLISSPLEERARYIYGLSQEISATLSQLDGVTTARVHVVMPETASKNKPLRVSSASVFIKHTSSVNLEDFIPQIKMLVNNSIEGLSYDNISVALFPTQTFSVHSEQTMKNVLSIPVATKAVNRFYGLIAIVFLLLLISITANVLFYSRFIQNRKITNDSLLTSTEHPQGQLT